MSSAQKSIAYRDVDVSYTTFNLKPHPSEPTLIFIHGWCCSSALWSAQQPLYSIRPSVLIDLPGHGNSSKPDGVDYSIEFYARSVIAVLEAESIQNVVLIAHSLGGVIATTLLRLLGEERVKGIVYISSFWLMPAHYLTSEQRTGLKEALRNDAFMWSMFEYSFSNSSPDMVARVRRVMQKDTPMHVRQGVFTDSLPHHWSSSEVYARTPMLHITYAGAAEWDEQSARHLPGLVVERWESVSIFLFLDRPEKFNARVAKFLNDNEFV